MKSKKIDRYGHSLESNVDFEESGDGYTCKEIAEMLGVLNISNDNPNTRAIKKIVEKFDLKHSGVETTSIQHSSNGGHGLRISEKFKYNGKELKFIKGFIAASDIPDSKGHHKVENVAFRKK